MYTVDPKYLATYSDTRRFTVTTYTWLCWRCGNYTTTLANPIVTACNCSSCGKKEGPK